MEMRQDTKITMAAELLEGGMSKGHIANRWNFLGRTIIRWAQGFQKSGSLGRNSTVYLQRKLSAIQPPPCRSA